MDWAGQWREVPSSQWAKNILCEHGCHVACSSIKLSALPFNFTKMPVTLPECAEQDHDHVFLPFFCDNLGLFQKYTTTSTTKKQTIQTPMEELNNFISQEATNQRFHTGGHPNRKGTEKQENDWTKRLVLMG